MFPFRSSPYLYSAILEQQFTLLILKKRSKNFPIGVDHNGSSPVAGSGIGIGSTSGNGIRRHRSRTGFSGRKRGRSALQDNVKDPDETPSLVINT